MILRVLSFDFDGCLFHSKYVQAPKKDVIELNKQLLEALKEDNHLYFKSIAFVGSNRQSKSVDDHNSYNKGSCFPAMQQIAECLSIELDSFLLADLYADLKPGTSFERAIKNEDFEEHARWVFDESKVSILYAQMHKIAEANQNVEIVFEFFDDRVDVLEGINYFFTTYQEIMPQKLTLKLHYYKGGDVVPLFELKGNEKGLIDEDYCQTIKDMAFQIGADYHEKHNFAYTVDMNLIPRKTSTSSMSEMMIYPSSSDELSSSKITQTLESTNASDGDSLEKSLEASGELKTANDFSFFKQANQNELCTELVNIFGPSGETKPC